jgi:hypothetical protein
MDWCGIVGTRAETCGDFTPDLTIAARLIVEAPFKHTQDNVIVAYYEPLYFSRLALSQSKTIGLPLVTHTSGQAGQDGMNDTIQTLVNVEHKLAEIRKASRT